MTTDNIDDDNNNFGNILSSIRGREPSKEMINMMRAIGEVMAQHKDEMKK